MLSSGQNRIVTLDLGSNKIAAAMAAVKKNGDVSILAAESLRSRGITGGEITDVNKATEDISSIMSRLARSANKKIQRLFVTTKGSDIRMDASRGIIPLSKSSREITRKDLRKCIEIAEMVKLPMDRAMIQRIIRGFFIDDIKTGIANPLGLYGTKLEVEAFIVTASRSKIQNITKCVDRAGFLLGGVFLSSTSSANAVLEGEEKEKGVLLLDIGDTLTEGLIFKQGSLKDYRLIGKGAGNITDSTGSAEKTALLHELKVALYFAESEISQVVITGGGALLDGLIEEAEKVFEKPVRIGIVKNTPGLLNPQDAIIHTSTIGLIDQLAREYKNQKTRKNILQRAFHNLLYLYETYF